MSMKYVASLPMISASSQWNHSSLKYSPPRHTISLSVLDSVNAYTPKIMHFISYPLAGLKTKAPHEVRNLDTRSIYILFCKSLIL